MGPSPILVHEYMHEEYSGDRREDIRRDQPRALVTPGDYSAHVFDGGRPGLGPEKDPSQYHHAERQETRKYSPRYLEQGVQFQRPQRVPSDPSFVDGERHSVERTPEHKIPTR